SAPTASTAPTAPAVVPRSRLVSVAAAGAIGGALLTAAAAWILTRPAPQPPLPITRFAIVPPPAQALSVQGTDRDSAISPDGSHIVYRAGTGLSELVLRRLDQLEGQVLTGISLARAPCFSPDGGWIGCVGGPQLKKGSI